MALGIAVFSLGTIVYLSLARQDDDDGASSEVSAPFADIKETDIHTIRLEIPGRDPVQLEYRDGVWRMIEPLALSTDTIHMEAFLDELRRLRLQRIPVSGNDKSLYFQEHPAGRLIVADRELWFGKNNPLDYQRYMEYRGEVYLAPDNIMALINRELFFANRNLWPEPYPPGEIKINGRTWRASASEEWRQTALAWQNARAIEIKRHDDTEAAESVSTLSARRKNGSWVNYRIVEKTPDLVLARIDQGVRYLFPSPLLDELVPVENND